MRVIWKDDEQNTTLKTDGFHNVPDVTCAYFRLWQTHRENDAMQR